MLAYAFRVLSEQGYVNIKPEQLSNTTNLLSAILDKGVTQLIKRGIRSDYVQITESMSSPKGKINIAESIKNQYTITRRLVCEHEEFVSDILLNQIIKATMKMAIGSDEVDGVIKNNIKKSLSHFNHISDISPKTIDWAKIRYDRNNAFYKMIINVCYLLVSGLLQTQEEGNVRLANIIDDQKMHRLYERFILEYYKRHYPMFSVSASKILWNTKDEDSIVFLPTMKSDVTIKYRDLTLVVDAKYYSQTLQTGQFGNSTINSGNIYQIFTYVKNLDTNNSGKVSGVLLYARTDEAIAPDQEVTITGNRFIITTLDLNQPFENIAKQLDNVIIRWTGESLKV